MSLPLRPDREQLDKAVEAIKVVVVNYPTVSETTPLISLFEGLSIEANIIVPEEYSDVLLAHLGENRDEFVSRISEIVSSVSPYLRVEGISYGKGSFFVKVFLGARYWVTDLIGTQYDLHAPVSQFPPVRELLGQVNEALHNSAIKVGVGIKGFFQSDEHP